MEDTSSAGKEPFTTPHMLCSIEQESGMLVHTFNHSIWEKRRVDL